MACSSKVSHSTFGHPEPAKLPKDTSTAMTLLNPFLIFVLHCHLNSRLPTIKRVGRQVRTVVPVDGSLHSLDMDAGGRQSHGVHPLAGVPVLVRRLLPRDAELGDELVDKPGRGGTHRHNSSQGSRLPRCAV